MHLVILALLIYIAYSEWRSVRLGAALRDLEKKLEKYKKDKTLWYSGVLPAAGRFFLFEDDKGVFAVSTLDDKRFFQKDEADFSSIKRWVYTEDLKNI